MGVHGSRACFARSWKHHGDIDLLLFFLTHPVTEREKERDGCVPYEQSRRLHPEGNEASTLAVSKTLRHGAGDRVGGTSTPPFETYFHTSSKTRCSVLISCLVL